MSVQLKPGQLISVQRTPSINHLTHCALNAPHHVSRLFFTRIADAIATVRTLLVLLRLLLCRKTSLFSSLLFSLIFLWVSLSLLFSYVRVVPESDTDNGMRANIFFLLHPSISFPQQYFIPALLDSTSILFLR